MLLVKDKILRVLDIAFCFVSLDSTCTSVTSGSSSLQGDGRPQAAHQQRSDGQEEYPPCLGHDVWLDKKRSGDR